MLPSSAAHSSRLSCLAAFQCRAGPIAKLIDDCRGVTCPAHWLKKKNAMPSVTVSGIEIHFAEARVGGRALLMVHGTLGDQRSFAAQRPPLAAAGCHVMVLSMRHCWPGNWPAEVRSGSAREKCWMPFGGTHCDMPASGMAQQRHWPLSQRADERSHVDDMGINAEIPALPSVFREQV